jgi:membrane-associated HD superfamily phosphohydrolase
VFGWVLGLQMLSSAPVSVAVFAAIQTIFLSACWRWGYLEAYAEKQKLRDNLVFIIAITFIILVLIEFINDISYWQIVYSLSFDGILLLGTAIAFALQITSLNLALLYGCAIVFAFLNFATVFDQFGFTFFNNCIFWRQSGSHFTVRAIR